MRDEKPYLDADFGLAALAARVGVRTEWLSQVLNQELAQSFSQYVNRYRIRAAVERVQASRREPNTLRIAHDVGFGSKSTFYRAFRAETGMTPRQFWRTTRPAD